MKIFITGCCGFIGFNFANFLAKTNKKIHVVGIDNFSDYYSVNYKKQRLKELVQNRNFEFYTVDSNGDFTYKSDVDSAFAVAIDCDGLMLGYGLQSCQD